MKFQVQRAHSYYEASKSALDKAVRQKFPAAELMRKTYEALLVKIETRQYNVFPRKVRVPTPRKVAIALSVWIPHFLRNGHA